MGVQRLLNDFEFEFLATLSAPIRAVQTMLLTKLLSNHAQDEVYLSTETPQWILVSPLSYIYCFPQHFLLSLICES